MIACPACEQQAASVFLTQDAMPVHQNGLYPTRKAARAAPLGDIHLALCAHCGFVFNAAFDLGLMNYDASYNNAQTHSTLFREYVEGIVQDLITAYDLHNKTIIEIGCGDGDFLRRLCAGGANTGIGFDPAYQPGPNTPENLRFIQDYYSAAYADDRADFYCSRHVIEHIPDIGGFLRTLRGAIRDTAAGLFFETPNVLWILRNVAFWDIFYEHCSLFSPGSLARAFARQGFGVTAVQSAFQDQYMWLKGHTQAPGTLPADLDTPADVQQAVQHFMRYYEQRIAAMRQQLANHAGRRVVVWGAAAKGSTFLNILNIQPERLAYVVDINPAKQGHYIPGTGQEIISPAQLPDLQPEAIILTNSNYAEEIQQAVADLGLTVDWIQL